MSNDNVSLWDRFRSTLRIVDARRSAVATVQSKELWRGPVSPCYFRMVMVDGGPTGAFVSTPTDTDGVAVAGVPSAHLYVRVSPAAWDVESSDWNDDIIAIVWAKCGGQWCIVGMVGSLHENVSASSIITGSYFRISARMTHGGLTDGLMSPAPLDLADVSRIAIGIPDYIYDQGFLEFMIAPYEVSP